MTAATLNALVGGRVRERRAAAGLTLRGLARACGLSVGYLSDLEGGKRGIGLDSLLAVAAALDCAPEWFYGPALLRAGRGPRHPCGLAWDDPERFD